MSISDLAEFDAAFQRETDEHNQNILDMDALVADCDKNIIRLKDESNAALAEVNEWEARKANALAALEKLRN